MTRLPSLSARRSGASLALAAIVAGTVASNLAAAPAEAAQPGSITFATTVTTVRHALPLFRLAHTAAPTGFVGSVLSAKGDRALVMEQTRLVSRDARHVLQAYVDPTTGDAEIFPDLAVRHGAVADMAAVNATAANVFARTDIVPRDVTTTRVRDTIPMFDSVAARGAHKAGAPKQLFTYVSAQRIAAGLPVVGSGSQATVAVDNDGSVRGLVRHWQAARIAGSVAPTTTAAQLTGAISAQLRSLANAHTTITVDSIAPAYYDGNGAYLQPVYEFYATVHPTSRGAASDHVRGYIPVGKLLERLPVIGQNTGRAPSAPHPATGIGADNTTITLGEYANRDGTMQDMANAYYNGFGSVPWFIGFPTWNRTQWYWAYPYEVESYANWYLNAVNVAYTMPHGDWYLNTTYSNYADLWYVNNIGTGGNPGYGAASGGILSTWIIDSCEVVPSYYDQQVASGNGYNAFNYWWPVFQGLHRVLGFRTQMLLGEDSMNYNIAQNMAFGANAESAFFNGVAAVGFPTYPDAHLYNTTVHYDRVSVFYDTRNAGESIYSTFGQSAAGQLHNDWMGN